MKIIFNTTCIAARAAPEKIGQAYFPVYLKGLALI